MVFSVLIVFSSKLINYFFFFFFNDTPTTEIYTLSLHDALPIWLPAVTNAFNIFLLKRFFDSIPNELLQAAEIDGAGPLRVLWSIIIPVSRPIIGVVAIFSVAATFKDFLWPLLVQPSATT